MNKVIKLFAIVAIMASSLALEAQNFDFSASCESGQTLYYKITGANEVEITYPNTDMFPYLGPQMPVGNVSIPSMVTFEGHEYEVSAIGEMGFKGCNSMTGELVIPNSVKKIGQAAFKDCTGLTGSLAVPNSVSSIGAGAFEGCVGMTGTLSLPASLSYFGHLAFSTCWESFVVDEDSPFFFVDSNCIIMKSDSALVLGCKNSVIPDYVKAIGYGAFYKCSELNGELVLPDCLEEVGTYAFKNCYRLSGDLVVPDHVKKIGTYAFSMCYGFNSMTLGKSVQEIQAFAFADTHNFQYIVSKNPIAPPSAQAFDGVGDVPVIVPCGALENYQNAVEWKDFSSIEERNLFEIEAVSANEEHGSVEIYQMPDDCLDNTAAVLAVPRENHSFINWTEDGVVVSEDSLFFFPLESDRHLVANFQYSNIGGSQSSLINVFPNPTKGLLNINAENVEMIRVFDVNGLQVSEMKAISEKNCVLDLTSLPSGCYAVQIVGKHGAITRMVVKD